MALRSLLRCLKTFRQNVGGNTAIIFGLSAIPVIGAVGGAVDYSRASSVAAAVQMAMDAAVIAGAEQTTASAQSTVAASVFSANYTASGGVTVSTPSWTPNASANTFSGTVNVSVPATIARLLGLPAFTFTTTATAGATPTTSSTKVCILVLDKSSSQTLLVNSGVNLNAPDCEIDVASTNPTAAMINSSLPNVSGVCIAGGSTINGGAKVNNLTNHCTVATDPYANTIAAPSISTTCTVSNMNYNGSVTLNPGTYCGGINFNGGTVTFNPGNYVLYNANFNFNGSGTFTMGAGVYALKGTHWNVNSGWSFNGTGVTFYYADASSYIQFNSNVKVDLAAPTTGTYANILMFEPNGLATSQFAIDGSSTSHALQGMIYLPSRNITFNSVANLTAGDGLTLVVNQIIFDTVTWAINPAANAVLRSSGTTTKGAVHLLR